MATMNMSDWGWNPPECPLCASHAEDCGCWDCHEHKEHDVRDWNVYPPCEGCQMELEEMASEN